MKGEKFFTLPDGSDAELFKLRLADGFGADITNFGGCVTALFVPDADGNLRDIALGWKNPSDYLNNSCYFGTLVGRTANRITAGKFELDGKVYQSCLNDNNVCSLHGGFGFSHRLWQVETATDKELILTLFSPHGDGGYPGNLRVRVSYRLRDNHTFEIEYSAESDRPTVADFTNHTYFNLNGENSGVCADHIITLAADFITETDEFLQPTGKLLPVDNSCFDLRKGKKFADILSEYEGGFDDNFVLGNADHVYRENAATVTAASGIVMKLHTSRPGIQVYMGGFLNGDPGKSVYPRNSGFCLETQSWPDSVNHANFPSIRVEPGKPHHSITRYEFGIVK